MNQYDSCVQNECKTRIFVQIYASVIAVFECCNRNLVT